MKSLPRMAENKDFCAKIITAQCRQNTNYDIVRYAAHPFFLQGYTALANGENTFYEKKNTKKDDQRTVIFLEKVFLLLIGCSKTI